jgi:hypothetical protein
VFRILVEPAAKYDSEIGICGDREKTGIKVAEMRYLKSLARSPKVGA